MAFNDEYVQHLSSGFFQRDKLKQTVDNSTVSRTDEIFARIVEKALERDMTPRAVSLKATRQPDAVTAIRRGHMPNPDRLRAIADVLGVDSEWLLNGGDAPAPQLSDARNLFRHRDFPRDVPIYGTALGADLEINGNGHAEPIEVTNVEMAGRYYT